ncbi:PTS system transporter subunit IIB [Streptococcus pneumoniae]|nr:PTS system transporter subunit IIB [Streptococcus pneumoniae]VQD91390.1 PTS system transporter subunit IIB [Streptococcus pneumoniae]VQV27544.1 PTS system transporter subunit IIB [Streptococcus pneumoniae]VSU79997.1 PTS system transporter subunit IIB [Streptococcus pneumoniae]
MLNIKEKDILQFLIKNKERFVTSKELAEYLSCSDRTVRNVLKLIEKTMIIQGVRLISKQGQGYQIFFENQGAYQEFRQTYELEEDYTKTAVSKGDDRLVFILNKLLFEQVPVLFDDLADELYVSRSTLSHDFRKIRVMLSEYNLSIESRANKGVYVSGEERDKRRFIINYFLENQFFKTIHCYVKFNFFDQTVPLEEFARIVLDECQEANLKLSDFVLQNLVVHIALSVIRLKSGFEIKNIDCQMTDDAIERKVAQRILSKVREVTNQEFPVQEIDYITLHLLAKSQQCQKNQKNISEEVLKKSLFKTFQNLGLDDMYNFSSDFQLIEGLITHLMTLQVRLESRITLNNPLVDEIKQNYSDIFFMTREILANMDKFLEWTISDDEVAYVSLHFLAAMERSKESTKFNILAICATGFGAAQMLRNRLETEFGKRVEVVDVIGYYELNQEKLKGIDFIVSAVDLSNLYFQIPVFKVSVFLKSDEMEMIRKANEFEQSLLYGIKQREELSSVVFSEKIAVPHPIQPFGTEGKVSVAICKDSLLWDNQSSHVQLVFLLSPSIYGNEGLATVTKKIVSLTENDELQNQLISCNNFEDFINIFEKIK